MWSFHTSIVGENLVNIFNLRQVNPLAYVDCWTSLELNDGLLAMDKPRVLWQEVRLVLFAMLDLPAPVH